MVWSQAGINILWQSVLVDGENRSFSRMPHFGAAGAIELGRDLPPLRLKELSFAFYFYIFSLIAKRSSSSSAV